jgi:hypothetical protein
MPTIRRIRIIRHSAVPDTGNFEVRFADGRGRGSSISMMCLADC